MQSLKDQSKLEDSSAFLKKLKFLYYLRHLDETDHAFLNFSKNYIQVKFCVQRNSLSHFATEKYRSIVYNGKSEPRIKWYGLVVL